MSLGVPGALGAVAPPVQETKRAPTFHFEPGGPVSDAQLGEFHATLECAIDGEGIGAMTLAFWPEKAPKTVRNFLRYCDEGFYDGVTFHRVLRDFMIQGGDPGGTGTGNGPYGTIVDEFSTDDQWAHRYGVISMAHIGRPNTASCQFFICNDDSPGVWNLDGKYASFGRLVAGVATLEALSNAPVEVGGAERSKPTRRLTIEKATVHRGAPPATSDVIARPMPDLRGEPAKVTVQHVLISFSGTGTTATRTKEEAAALAAKVLARAQAGEDFTALVRELSDDPNDPDDPKPGVYEMFNHGVRDVAAERALYLAQRDATEKARALNTELQTKVRAGEMSQIEMRQKLEAYQKELKAGLQELAAAPRPRAQMVTGFGDVAFSLEVGGIGTTEFDPASSKFGWHIIRRLE